MSLIICGNAVKLDIDSTCLDDQNLSDNHNNSDQKKSNLYETTLIGKGTFAHVYSIDKLNMALKIATKSTMNKSFQKEVALIKSIRRKDQALYDKVATNAELSGVINSNELSCYSNCFAFTMPLAIMDFFTLLESQLKHVQCHSRVYATQLALALEALEQFELVHADIKLENVLCFKSVLGQSYNLKLCDFGFVFTKEELFEIKRQKEHNPDSIYLDKRGSNSYAAPEVFEYIEYSYKSDIWALGVIFYSICTQFIPWQQASKDDENFSNWQENGALPLSEEAMLNKTTIEQICPEIVSLFPCMLAIEPNKRPSAFEIRDKLEN